MGGNRRQTFSELARKRGARDFAQSNIEIEEDMPSVEDTKQVTNLLVQLSKQMQHFAGKMSSLEERVSISKDSCEQAGEIPKMKKVDLIDPSFSQVSESNDSSASETEKNA